MNPVEMRLGGMDEDPNEKRTNEQTSRSNRECILVVHDTTVCLVFFFFFFVNGLKEIGLREKKKVKSLEWFRTSDRYDDKSKNNVCMTI